MERVEKWTFEQGCDVRLPIADGDMSFLAFFRTAYQAVKQLLPNAQVGGGAVFLYDDGGGWMRCWAHGAGLPTSPNF